MGCVATAPAVSDADEEQAVTKMGSGSPTPDETKSDVTLDHTMMFDMTREYTDEMRNNVKLIDQAYGIDIHVQKRKPRKYNYFQKSENDAKEDEIHYDVDFTRSIGNVDASKAIEEMKQLNVEQQVNIIFQHYYNKMKDLTGMAEIMDVKDDPDESAIIEYCINHINTAIDEDKTVKAISAGKCLQFETDIGYTENKCGIEIDLKKFTNAACEINRSLLTPDALNLVNQKLLVKCESGVTVHDIESQYWANLYSDPDKCVLKNPQSGEYYTCLPNRGGSDELSLVGLASVGAMGYGNNNSAPENNGPQFGGIQNIIESIRAITVETASKDDKQDEPGASYVIKHYQIEKTNGIHDKTKWENDPECSEITLIQDDETFNNWVTSVGTYGIITHVFVSMTQAAFYTQNRLEVKMKDWESKYDEICNDANIYKFEMYFVPYKDLTHPHGYCVYNTFCKADVSKPDSQHDIVKYGGVTRSSDTFIPRAAAAAVVLLANCPLLRDTTFAFALGQGLLATHTKKALTMTSVQALNFETGNLIKTNTMGVAFPMKDSKGNDNVKTVASKYVKFMEDQKSKKGWVATSPVALRFAKKSQGTISAAGDYDIAWLEQPIVHGTDHSTDLLDNNFFNFWQNEIKTGVKLNWGMYFPNKDLPKYGWKNVSNYKSFHDMYKQFNSAQKFCNNFTQASGLDN